MSGAYNGYRLITVPKGRTLTFSLGYSFTQQTISTGPTSGGFIAGRDVVLQRSNPQMVTGSSPYLNQANFCFMAPYADKPFGARDYLTIECYPSGGPQTGGNCICSCQGGALQAAIGSVGSAGASTSPVTVQVVSSSYPSILPRLAFGPDREFITGIGTVPFGAGQYSGINTTFQVHNPVTSNWVYSLVQAPSQGLVYDNLFRAFGDSAFNPLGYSLAQSAFNENFIYDADIQTTNPYPFAQVPQGFTIWDDPYGVKTSVALGTYVATGTYLLYSCPVAPNSFGTLLQMDDNAYNLFGGTNALIAASPYGFVVAWVGQSTPATGMYLLLPDLSAYHPIVVKPLDTITSNNIGNTSYQYKLDRSAGLWLASPNAYFYPQVSYGFSIDLPPISIALPYLSPVPIALPCYSPCQVLPPGNSGR